MDGDTRQERIYVELVRQTLKLAPTAIVATVLNAFVLVLILWEPISHSLLIIWFAATIGLALQRSIFSYKYRPEALQPDQAAKVAKWVVIGLALSGIIWGCAGLFLFPKDSPTHQILVVFVLCGMVAGAAGTFSSIFAAFLAFTLPTLIPLFIRFLIIGGPVYYAMSAMTLLYMGLTLIIARRINITNRELVDLKEHFAQMVEEQTAELLYANEQLKRQIEERERVEEERGRLERHLQNAQKMESIATLAGGIAHQFNNALSVIIGYIELLEMTLPVDIKMSKYIHPLKTSAQRMGNLTNQLLAYARGGKYQPKNISLSALVQDTLPLIKHNVDTATQMETDLADNVYHVNGDHVQLQTVLSAVVTNAAEAIESSGAIRITTANQEIDAEHANRSPGLKPGFYVCLTVEDNGKGMDADTSARVFEPFFTTKLQGRGLGMAAAYGIIKNHGGWIGIDSKLGEGTVARIYLPAVPRQETVPEESQAEPPAGTGTIMVVEDEEMLMEINRSILERIGYRVLEAKTGEEAIHIAKSYEGEIDLAILDMGLPDMEGRKVYKFIKECRPYLKVIVCSGYAIDGPVQEVLDAGAQAFMQKPFSLVALSARLKATLES
jgi:signal transduction histidine kinase/CheY-like chemotaxis protein